MSDAISSIGSAAVTTVGTVAVAGMAIKAVGKATGGMNRSSGGRKSTGTKKSGNYNVWNGTKGSHKKSKSMLGW